LPPFILPRHTSIPVRDIITGIDGVTFEEGIADKLEIDIWELRIGVISLPNLIRNKEASARPKDLLDLQNLRRMRHPRPKD